MDLHPPCSPDSALHLIVAITGASGAVYGQRLLQVLHGMTGVHTHLVVSEPGWMTVQQELGMSRESLLALANTVHGVQDVGASIASGSFPCHGMVVAPCSMRTLSAIAMSSCDNLITRAADVTLKERRRLVLMVREAPLHLGHLRNMVSVTEMGGIVFPPMPAFYHCPSSIDELVGHSVERVLALLGLATARPWRPQIR
ncbi:UbiX family flavin prenyltransferase [Candidatus Symbiobacter mobilis]|uniref:Flavin prenyltransferase UbiX n=1 Tax=Candidatus Symbiobacter mobilis CR TaxID=946483 RepID=U5N7P5_9BURK|nr:UbiX family flavin prenyltransferase [Candidatus Symbiobacter mobilis]AGX86313.1 3-polyprenyl-4-hydroxybenzoate carboxy-lyase UbiX [Candidatus Symbiobacter mobilis CR]